MRIFISAGEPSGDVHGANLARAVRRLDPSAEFVGFGGAKMASAGVALRYPLADHAIMGFVRVLAVVPRMWRLMNDTIRYWERERPDAVVLIDYPGFHWFVAKAAHRMGIPVISFVPPQIWAWASHRVKRMRRNFTRVLCSLPFEEPWFRERGVNAEYVGHPFFDELPQQRLDDVFLASETERGGEIVALLPGSRGHEVHANWPSLRACAERVHRERPTTRFLVACFKPHQRDWIASQLPAGIPIDLHIGRTPEILSLARACVAVSGSVGLELLYRRLPSVVIYRVSAFYVWLKRTISHVPYISIVNLLAGRPLFPEYFSSAIEGDGPAGHILEWLNNPATAERTRGELGELLNAVGQPGACAKAAAEVLALARRTTANERAA